MGAGGGFESSLEAIRLDGWYTDFLATVPDVEVLAPVFGPRGLGYLMLAGVRLEMVSVDRSDPGGSNVDVLLPDGRVARAPARLLVRRAIEALAEQIVMVGPRPTAPDIEAIRVFLGGRLVLLASMHGFRLLKIRFESTDEPTVEVEHEATTLSFGVISLRRVLVTKLEEDLRALDGLVVDEERIIEARAAAGAGDHHRVLELLEPFAGPLVSSLRSGAAARMESEERASLVDTLDLFASAHIAGGDLDTAQTLLRLGAQGCKGEPESARLHFRLGELAMKKESAGEAIGSFRHAIALGASLEDVGPLLASAFVARGRLVAALAVRDASIAAGADEKRFAELLAIETRLGSAYAALRDRLNA